MTKPVVVRLANQTSRLIRTVTTDVALVAIILVAWYLIEGLPVAGTKLVGSYTFGNLVWLGMWSLIAILAFDIAQRFTPFLASAMRKRYKGKRVLDWNELAKAATSITVLIAIWLFLMLPVGPLAYALGSLLNPSLLLGLYHVLLWLAIAYYTVSAVIRSEAPRVDKPEAPAEVSWNGSGEAVRVSQYLKRLEALKSSGNIDERTYDKLRLEYETKLREAIELPRRE